MSSSVKSHPPRVIGHPGRHGSSLRPGPDVRRHVVAPRVTVIGLALFAILAPSVATVSVADPVVGILLLDERLSRPADHLRRPGSSATSGTDR